MGAVRSTSLRKSDEPTGFSNDMSSHREILGTSGGPKEVEVRELYAVQLDLQTSPESTSATQLAQEWVARGAGTTLEEVRESSGTSLRTATGHELEFALEPGTVDGWTCCQRRSKIDPFPPVEN